MWWWLGVALAGDVELQVSPGATVEVLPSTVAGRVDLVVHGNSVPLQPQVRGARGGGVRWIRPVDLGGDQVLRVRLAEGFHGLSAVRTAAGFQLEASTAPPVEQLAVEAPPSLESLLDGSAAPASCTPRALPLAPLVGTERSWMARPSVLRLALPRWEEAEPSRTAWSEVARQREILQGLHRGESPPPPSPARARALYALGALHRDLGHTREAAYYFGAANEEHGGDSGVSALQRAGALATLGAGGEALAAAGIAARLGAPEEGIAAVVAAAAAAGAAPAAPAARALLANGALPADMVRAGDLLLRDRCDAEAASVLSAAVRHVSGEAGAYARLLLSDALALSGDPSAAAVPLAEIDLGWLPRTWRRLPRVRGAWLAMVQRSPDSWLAEVPTLDRLASDEDLAGTEALVLLAQIHAVLGQPGQSLAAYLEVADRRRDAVAASVVTAMASAWEERTRELFVDARPFDAALLFSAAWRPQMRAAIVEPELLAQVAEAQVAASLPGPAVRTLGILAAVQGERGLDDRATILSIAEIYVSSGRHDEAEESLRSLLRRDLSPSDAARAAFVRGQVAAARGDHAVARRELSAAAGEASVSARASRALALLDARAGRCDSAREVLAAAAAGGTDPEARDAWIGCEVARGAAVPMADGTSDGDAFARYRAALARPGDNAWMAAGQGDTTWAALAREEAVAAGANP